jgi:flagellar assembly factor FliW
VRFLVVPPAPFYPAYAPEIGDEVVSDLGIERAEDVFVLVVVDARKALSDTTANLRAPVVVNTATGRAAQVVLDDASQPLAAPLLA